MGRPSKKEKNELVKVQVDLLKRSLNHAYDTRRDNRTILAHDGLFEYLWDLKERALMEGRESVEVPTAWVEELDSNLLVIHHPHAEKGH